MDLETPVKIQKLQEALHAKAKASPGYRFYLLYDKVYRADILRFAWERCRDNGGVSGVDGQTFKDIAAYGVDRWLDELTQALRTKTYRPEALRRGWSPKPDGSKRPLGIPTIRDRVVQTALLLVLDPIFEADLQPEQYAYRPGRGALDAVQRVVKLLHAGHREVVDADLSGYFDSIPHAELMKSVARRISDRHVLHLIKMWIQAAVEEEDERGRKRRTTVNKDTGRGTSQGSPISPLLSNIYMRRFVLGWKTLGYERKFMACIVNYADDFVICCRGTAQQAMAAMRDMMTRLKLAVNESKTRICKLPEEPFNFLGYTIGLCYSGKRQCLYLGTRPARKAIAKLCAALHERTRRCWIDVETKQMVYQLNSRLSGWANYFRLGSVSKAYRIVDAYVRDRMRQWLRWKHKLPRRDYTRFTKQYLYEELGLIELAPRTRSLPWATA